MRFRWLVIGGLVLALLAVCAAIVGISALTLSRAVAGGLRLNAFRVENISAEADEEQRFTVSAPARLDLENGAGHVTITGGSGDEIVIAMHKTGWGATQAEAEAALADLKVTILQSGDTVTIRVIEPNELTVVGSDRADSVDFTILVPAQTEVRANTRFGDVSLSETEADAELHSDFGRMTASDVDGALVATTSSGRVTARRIQAGDGAVTLKSDFGSVTLENVRAGQVEVHSSSGALELTDVAAAGAVTVSTDFGAVTLNAVSADSYDLRSSSGRIDVDGAAGPLKAYTDFGDIEIQGAEAVTLDVHTSSGTIAFSGSLGDGPHTVETEFGGVTLALPAASALDVDLETEFGTITSDFPITVEGDFSQTRLSGALNGGGARLRVHTSSGNITLESTAP